jgi:hypothetical protein
MGFLKTPKSDRYTWTGIMVAFGGIIGLVFVGIYFYTKGINGLSAMMWSLTYMVIGTLVGFIFSVPKLISDSPTGVPPAGTNIAKKKVEENTNLTQISDWLTKVLIGAGLVEMKEIPPFIHQVATVMGKGIAGTSNPTVVDDITVMCAAIILFFLSWGFISGYLVMKLILTEQFADSDGDDD